MNLRLSSAHMETLVELIGIAKKHNCRICVHVGDAHLFTDMIEEIGEFMVCHKTIDEVVFNELAENDLLSEAVLKHDYVRFELLEMAEDGYFKANTMTYHVYDLSMDIGIDTNLALSEKAEDWIKANAWQDYEGMYRYHYEETDKQGFDGVSTYYDVYREGMALKFFGDLVCDYLQEPRIVRSY